MRYAIGLSAIAAGAILVYSGFTNKSAWDLVLQTMNPNYKPTTPERQSSWTDSYDPIVDGNDTGSVSGDGRIPRTDYENAV